MCGRYTLIANADAIGQRFDVKVEGVFLPPRYNIAPTQEVLAVTNEGERRVGLMRWGIIPFWAKDPSIGQRMINARAERLAEKPAFRRALERRRCLVLADGFYEWMTVEKRRVPMRFALKSGEPFAFAGLWDVWRAPTGESVRSCTIITTEPNAVMAPIHNRMPVILARTAEAPWLDTSLKDYANLARLLAPYAETEMEAYEVSVLVNSPKNDSPECIARVTGAV